MRYIFLYVLLAVATTLPAQVQVEARLDTADILIGEQVRLRSTVNVDSGAKVRFPQFPEGTITDGVEVLGATPVDTVFLQEGKRLRLVRHYTITAFDSALYYLPALEVEVNGKTYRSNGNIGLKVSTVPVDTLHPDEFPGPHGAVADVFEWDGRLYSLSLLLWAVLAGIFVLAVRLSSNKPATRRVVVKPPVPPHKRAIEAIDRLSKPEVGDREAVKAYYVELTEVLRTYIDERYGFGAREMTSAEILSHLEQNATESVLFELREIFSTADLVKFAKQTASMGETERSLVKAADFVNTTKQAPHELPKPVVREVTLDERRQRWWRMGLKAAMAVLALSEAVLAAWLCVEMYDTFF